jgi:hypothetical protein
MDYAKIKENVEKLAANLGAKVKEAAAGVVDAATGNSGGLGQAKADLKSRQQKIDDAVEEASGQKKMANGGRVGYHKFK